MNNEFTKQVYYAYIEAGQMLLNLIRRIEEMDKLKRNHKAYLYAQNELIKAAGDYDERLEEVRQKMARAIAEVNKDVTPPVDWIKALLGNFVMLPLDRYKKLYDGLINICIATSLHLKQTNGMDNKSCHYQAINAFLKALCDLKDNWDEWDRTEVYHWHPGEESDDYAG